MWPLACFEELIAGLIDLSICVCALLFVSLYQTGAAEWWCADIRMDQARAGDETGKRKNRGQVEWRKGGMGI